jgi:hypothetical protein
MPWDANHQLNSSAHLPVNGTVEKKAIQGAARTLGAFGCRSALIHVRSLLKQLQFVTRWTTGIFILFCMPLQLIKEWLVPSDRGRSVRGMVPRRCDCCAMHGGKLEVSGAIESATDVTEGRGRKGVQF